MDGARGIDYAFKVPSHVIMAFNPESYSLVIQGLSRGSRKANQ